MPLSPETIGARLKEARVNLGLSQEQVADAVGMDRTAILKVEKGTRSITSMELAKLARLFRRDASELLSDEPLVEDPFKIVGRIVDNMPPARCAEVEKAIQLLKEAVHLEQLLEDRIRQTPPVYKLYPLRDFESAIEQGRHVAILERQRVGLGKFAVPDMAQFIASQGIWAAAVWLPLDTMGLFLSHAKYGMATFVNQQNFRARRRFSYAHEYAHALFDRDRTPEASSRANASELIEKRANAFASEFLMPEDGIWEALERKNKGGASRVSSWQYNFYAHQTDESQYEFEEAKVDSEARRIGFADVVFLAMEFRVSYEMAAIRLKDISAIRKPVLDEFLLRKGDARKLISALWANYDTPNKQPYLNQQVMELAFEALRREKVTRSKFINICTLAGQPPDVMLDLAESM